ncbi:PREDICTED: CD63 antigen [Sturnus vulgaris]|uniref:CD63 antigen n=1 Tax=Sturnus vulgaris TaxID=9172 RepID=UPI000719F7BB|nr:PREDICTED: CD63 antigen [Sturnus vulgaris]
MRKYELDPPLAATLDTFQQEFSCCGVNNYTDWASVEPFGANHTVPRSCCRVVADTCNVRPSPATVFEKGCLPSLEAWVRRNIVVLAAVPLGIAFFEVRDPQMWGETPPKFELRPPPSVRVNPLQCGDETLKMWGETPLSLG